MGVQKLKTAAKMKTAVAAGLSCLLALGGAGMSAVATEAPTGLSVTITADADEVAPGSDVSYTAELSNAGSEAVAATLVVTVPGYVEITAADGAVTGGAETPETDAAWAVTVEPGAVAAVTVGARIGEIPAEELRVTTLVSVYLGEGAETQLSAPIIRSAIANTIAGVIDVPLQDPVDPKPGDDAALPAWVMPAVIAAAALILVLVGGGAVLVVRRRRAGTGSAPRESRQGAAHRGDADHA